LLHQFIPLYIRKGFLKWKSFFLDNILSLQPNFLSQ